MTVKIIHTTQTYEINDVECMSTPFVSSLVMRILIVLFYQTNDVDVPKLLKKLKKALPLV